jgi:hypothetical protein
MPGERYFCAEASRAHGETVFGTVAQIRSWLLLEYPGAWRRNAVEDSRLLSPAFKTHFSPRTVDRTLLIRQEHRRSGPLRCYFVHSREDAAGAIQHSVDDYDDLIALNEPGQPSPGLMFAVCTHGRHDRCCAKFGMPVWCAFRDTAGEHAWQCSHVGGDRFAANVVVFPYGIYYGRVSPEDAGEIVRRSTAGEIWLPGYRGRSCYPRRVQAAEYFARAESGRLRIDEFRLAREPHTEGAVTSVTFEAPSDRTLHHVEFAARPDAIVERLTCEATEPSGIAQYQLRSYSARRPA